MLPLYAGDLDDDAVRALLNELASEIGGILEEEEVYVGYRESYFWAAFICVGDPGVI